MKKFYRPVCILLTVITIAGCGPVRQTGSKSAVLVKIPAASVGMYAYEQLNDKEKAVYDVMEYAMVNHQDKVPVETLSDDDMNKVFFFVLKDHPEIFWCTGFVRHSLKFADATIETEFEPKYNMTKEERYEYKEKIDREVESWMAAIPSGATDYKKAKILFDTIVSKVDYDENTDNNQNIVSVFVNHRSVCKGYARAFQYLLMKAGIDATVINGSADGASHAWNLVKLDGEYYHFDVTWGDPSFTSNNNTDDFINYAYFGVTTKEILKTHTIDKEMDIPECDALKDNYFLREKLYFRDEDPAPVGKAIQNADAKHQKFVSLKFETEELYQWAMDYFIKKQHVFDFYSSSRHFFMYNNDELLILSIIREKGE